MAYYLQMDGVDDKIVTPSITFTKIVFDIFVQYRTSGAWNTTISGAGDASHYTFTTSGSSTQSGYNQNSTTIDGVVRAIFPQNEARYVVELFSNGSKTGEQNLFCNKTKDYFKARVYSIKFYNGENLVAHYDISTQSVQDQSGNGNHATLVGGTWIDDGTGGIDPVGTDVSYSYAMKQSIYADRTVQAQIKQSIYADQSNIFPTQQAVFADRAISHALKQVVYTDRQTAFPAKQSVYADRSWDYPLLQSIFSDYVLYSADFLMEQVIHADMSVSFPLQQVIVKDVSASYPVNQAIYRDTSATAQIKQTIYADRQAIAHTKQVIRTDREYSYAMLQQIIDPDKTIIGTIKLEGQRTLYVYLVGERSLYVSLEGGLTMRTNQNFSMVSGDSKYIDVPIADVDLAGAKTIKWILHQYGNIKVSKELTNGIRPVDASTVQITLEPEDTALLNGIYSHELEVTDAVGHVGTVMTGKATIEKGYIN